MENLDALNQYIEEQSKILATIQQSQVKGQTDNQDKVQCENQYKEQNDNQVKGQENNQANEQIDKENKEQNEKQLVIPRGWKQVAGDIKKLELDNNEFVVFEKEPLSINAVLTNEKTFFSSKDEQKVLRIMLKKYRVGYNCEQQEKYVETEDYKYGLWLFFGNSSEVNPVMKEGNLNFTYPTNFSYKFYEDFFESQQISMIFSFNNLPNQCYLNPHPFGSSKNLIEVLNRAGSVKTLKYSDFDIEWMNFNLLVQILDAYVENDFLTEDEAQFILKLAPTKKITIEEQTLYSKIQTALDNFKKNKYLTEELDKAVKWSHEIHALNLKNAKKRLTGTRHFSNKTRIYIDDSRAALDLALALEVSAPEYAIKALELFYEYNNKDLAESPYIKEALEKLSEIQLSLCGTASNDSNHVKNREIRKNAIKFLITTETDDNDKQALTAKITQLCQLFDLQCGVNPLNKKQSIFKKLHLNPASETYYLDFLYELMFKMTDEIFVLRKSLGLIEDGSNKLDETNQIKEEHINVNDIRSDQVANNANKSIQLNNNADKAVKIDDNVDNAIKIDDNADDFPRFLVKKSNDTHNAKPLQFSNQAKYLSLDGDIDNEFETHNPNFAMTNLTDYFSQNSSSLDQEVFRSISINNFKKLKL